MTQKVNQRVAPLIWRAGWSQDFVLLRDAEVVDLIGASVNGAPPYFRSGEALEKAPLVQVRCGGCGIVAEVEQWSAADRTDVAPVFILTYQLLENAGSPTQMAIHRAILRRPLTRLQTQCSVHKGIPLDADALLNAAGLALTNWRRTGALKTRRMRVSPPRSA